MEISIERESILHLGWYIFASLEESFSPRFHSGQWGSEAVDEEQFIPPGFTKTLF